MTPYEIDFLPEYTDEALLNELRRIAALLPAGKPLTKPAFAEHNPKVSHSTLRRRFGGWKEALDKAGLGHLYQGHPVSPKMRHQPGKNLSRDALLSEPKRVHALVGKAYLTRDDFNQHSITSVEAIRNRFGSFPKGLQVAGIPRSPQPPVSLQTQSALRTWRPFGRTLEERPTTEKCPSLPPLFSIATTKPDGERGARLCWRLSNGPTLKVNRAKLFLWRRKRQSEPSR